MFCKHYLFFAICYTRIHCFKSCCTYLFIHTHKYTRKVKTMLLYSMLSPHHDQSMFTNTSPLPKFPCSLIITRSAAMCLFKAKSPRQVPSSSPVRLIIQLFTFKCVDLLSEYITFFMLETLPCLRCAVQCSIVYCVFMQMQNKTPFIQINAAGYCLLARMQ